MDPISFVPQFGSLALTILAFVVALTVIVAIHEYGHYIVGRWTGIKADVFSIGVGPVLTSRVDKHGTKWQIAALPIGGFVKFRGDANAASAGTDGEAMVGLTDVERRATMPGAPVWARALTVAAGPVFNFILSIIVFAGFALNGGIATDPLTVAGVPHIPGYQEGLLPGDEILKINGQATPKLEAFADFVDTLPAASPMEYIVRRDGREMQVQSLHPKPAIVSAFGADSAAQEAGVEVGDLIIRAHDTEIHNFDQLIEIMRATKEAPIDLQVLRGADAQELAFTIQPRLNEMVPIPGGGFESRWLVGIGGGLLFDPANRAPTWGEAIETGYNQTKFVITGSLTGLYRMVAGDISRCNLRGAIGIAQTSGEAASKGLADFIWFIAVLSTAVGLLNLFPIPILDGGHLVFHAYEAVTRRKPADWAYNVLMMAGLVVVLGLMAFGLFNDLFCP